MDNDNTRNHNKAANVLATNTFEESLLLLRSLDPL